MTRALPPEAAGRPPSCAGRLTASNPMLPPGVPQGRGIKLVQTPAQVGHNDWGSLHSHTPPPDRRRPLPPRPPAHRWLPRCPRLSTRTCAPRATSTAPCSSTASSSTCASMCSCGACGAAALHTCRPSAYCCPPQHCHRPARPPHPTAPPQVLRPAARVSVPRRAGPLLHAALRAARARQPGRRILPPGQAAAAAAAAAVAAAAAEPLAPPCVPDRHHHPTTPPTLPPTLCTNRPTTR